MHLRNGETHCANGDKSKHELEKLKDARAVKIKDHHHEGDNSRAVLSRRHGGVGRVQKARRLNNNIHAYAKNIERRA